MPTDKTKLKTDMPLSEKDEVKKAERRIAKTQKGLANSVKPDQKSRDKQ